MNNEGKERRCKKCKKLLIDEKTLFCKRCLLESKNKVLQMAAIGTAIVTSAIVIKNVSEDN